MVDAVLSCCIQVLLCAGNTRGEGGALQELDVVYREEASAMLGFDVDALSGQDIAVVTDQECLVYMRRSL